MKAQITILLLLVLFLWGCKKTEAKRLPVTGTYILKGDKDTVYDNGIIEALNPAHDSLTLISGTQQAYGWSANRDTLFKDLWIGDKISITAQSYTSIYYQSGTTAGQYLVDSSSNTTASFTIN